MNFLSRMLSNALQAESLPERAVRMAQAAGYGVLVATAFLWTNALVNWLSFPRLPLALDLPGLLAEWAALGAAFGLAGLIAGWFTEEYQGIVGGGAILTGLLAAAFLVQMGDAPTAQSLLMALPLLGVGMLAAGALRWVARRHARLVREQGAFSGALLRHLVIVALVGAFAGVLGRFDLPAEQALSNLHRYLQAASEDPSAWGHLPVRQVPSLTAHFGQEYRFYVRRSMFAVGALDVTIRFADGFVLQCVIPVGNTAFFTDCWEGK